MKAVGNYEFPYEAHIAKGLLESEGINAEIFNEVSSYVSINACDGIKLMVNDEDYDAAVNVLAAASSIE